MPVCKKPMWGVQLTTCSPSSSSSGQFAAGKIATMLGKVGASPPAEHFRRRRALFSKAWNRYDTSKGRARSGQWAPHTSTSNSNRGAASSRSQRHVSTSRSGGTAAVGMPSAKRPCGTVHSGKRSSSSCKWGGCAGAAGAASGGGVWPGTVVVPGALCAMAEFLAQSAKVLRTHKNGSALGLLAELPLVLDLGLQLDDAVDPHR